MLVQPGHDVVVGVGAVVVEDHVDLESLGDLTVNGAQELQELAVAVPGKTLADHVEPALEPIYEHHAERTRRRWLAAWPFILGAIVPFIMAMLDKYAGIPLQWPIAVANVVLCIFYVLSIIFGIFFWEKG